MDNSSCGWESEASFTPHPERSESTTGGVAVVALFWLLDGQAEGGGRKDELACPSRGQTDFAQAPVCQLFSTVLLRAESWQSGALRLGRGGTRFPHFWPGVRSVWPWLGGLKGPSRRPSAEHGQPEVRLTLGASA